MNIVDADLRALQRASERGRVRSDETQQLIDAIDDLSPVVAAITSSIARAASTIAATDRTVLRGHT